MFLGAERGGSVVEEKMEEEGRLRRVGQLIAMSVVGSNVRNWDGGS